VSFIKREKETVYHLLEESASATLVSLLGLGSDSSVHCADLTDEAEESLIDICAGLGRSLEEGAVEALCGILTLSSLNLTLRGKIALVTAEDHGYMVGILHTENLFAELVDFIEGAAGGNGVDEKEALASAHVLVTHSAVLLLTGGIKDIKKGSLTVDGDLLPVAILDSGIVFIDEMVLDELDSKSGLADTTTANDNNLVFGHS